MPHYKFLELPREERIKWLIWVEEESKYHKKQQDEIDRKQKTAKMQANAQSAQNPGVTRKR